MSDSAVRATIAWTTDYTVGVRQIDEEHQRLFALAERMHRAMLDGEGKAFLEDLLSGLVAYAGDHFKHEEQLMERIRFPGYREHRQQHEDLRGKVRAMQDRSAAGEATMTIEIMLFLMNWLKGHTMASD